MPLSTIDKRKIMQDFALNDKDVLAGGDTGSAGVQIAVLTKKISLLTDHMKNNKKDFASKRGLIKMVSRRKRLLRYLKRTNEEKYRDIIGRLNLKDRD